MQEFKINGGTAYIEVGNGELRIKVVADKIGADMAIKPKAANTFSVSILK